MEMAQCLLTLGLANERSCTLRSVIPVFAQTSLRALFGMLIMDVIFVFGRKALAFIFDNL